MADDLSRQVRDLVERYRRSVHAMSGDRSSQVADALAHALRAIERARTRETISDDVTAELAIREVQRALETAGDPF